MSVKKSISAGASLLQYSRLHPSGYMTGLTSTLAAGGNGAGMSRLLALKQANIAVPEAQRATQTGDDAPQGSIIFPATELPGGDLQMGVFDLDFDAIAQNTLVHTVGGMRIGALSPADPEYVDLFLVISRPAKSKDSATSGRKRWQHFILPSTNAVPRGSSTVQERTFADNTYSLIINPVSKFPWGESLGTNIGTTEAPIFVVHTDYRLTFHAFMGNGVDDAFTLNKLPVGDEATDYFDIWTFSTGLDASGLLDSVNTATGEVTFTAAPADQAVYICGYQYENE